MNVLKSIRQDSRAIYILVVCVLSLASLLNLIPETRAWGSWVTPPICLCLGLIYALACTPAYPKLNKKLSKHLLMYAVIGLGFGMNCEQALASGKAGMLFTIISVGGTMILGLFLAKHVFGVKQSLAYLISAGTAICGGSAIATISPIIQSKERDTSLALGLIFLLNALGLFIFPTLGRWFGLSESAFGMWAAIAIHDTSSVVGAAAAYGEEALQLATMIKLTRALWIIPLALVSSVFLRRKGQSVSIPWFIVGFILAMLTNTYLLKDAPQWGQSLAHLARLMLNLTMFFIGASLSLKALKDMGLRPLLFALCLWAIVSTATLIYIVYSL